MRKYARLLLCLLFVTVASFAPPQKKNKHRKTATAQNDTYRVTGSPMPDFRVITSNGSVLTNDSLEEAGNIILMLFNPTCDHCGMVTDTLLRYLKPAQKSRLLLVAGDNMMPYLPQFIKEHQLEKYPAAQISVGVDSSGLIQKTFLYEPLPQVNIYDSTRSLLRILTGLQPGSSFIPFLN